MDLEKAFTGRCFVKTSDFLGLLASLDVCEGFKEKVRDCLRERMFLEDEEMCSFQLGISLGQLLKVLTGEEFEAFGVLHEAVRDGDRLPFRLE